MASSAHRGVPVGIVRIGPSHVHNFRQLLDKTLGIKTRFRGVERVEQGNGSADGGCGDGTMVLLAIHLPPTVCAALDDKNPALVAFLDSVGGQYSAGVRRSKSTAARALRRGNEKRRLPASHQQKQKEKRPRDDNDDGSDANDGNSSAAKSGQKSQDEEDGDRIEQCKSPNLVQCQRGQNEKAPLPSFTFVELFAGIGGFRLGLEAIGGKCVLSSEINPHSVNIYEQNFGSSELREGDILDLDSTEFGTFTMLTAGFPCQPFTNRGERQGLDDDRGQMYRECARILHDQRPECFLFENVVGLVTMEGGSRPGREKGSSDTCFVAGRVFERILNAFKGCGYNVDWNVINSRHFLPQNRERLYIVGTRNDVECDSMRWDNILSEGSGIGGTVRNIMEDKDSLWAKRSELSSSQWAKVQDMHAKKGTDPYQDGRIDPDGKAPTIITNYRRVGSFSTRFLFEQSDGTVCAGKDDHRRPRFLTPSECASLMGFPNDFCVPSATEEEDNVAHFYQAIGNAVNPPVLSAIGKELLRCIGTTCKQSIDTSS